MDTRIVTLQLSNALYQSAKQLALATHRPLEQVLQGSIERALPPLDDVPPEEAAQLAKMALLDDRALWRQARAELPQEQQNELQQLLEQQNLGVLTAQKQKQLERLLDAYGKLTVRKAHAWLLLARRGYQVPVQS